MTTIITKPRCKVPGCKVQIEADKLMCDEHWLKLSLRVRHRLFEVLQDAFAEARGDVARSA